jgi:hypothetical protein
MFLLHEFRGNKLDLEFVVVNIKWIIATEALLLGREGRKRHDNGRFIATGNEFGIGDERTHRLRCDRGV